MSSQISNNNNYAIAPASPNPYVSRKLNNMDQAQVMKREREDWMRLYHKTLKGLETMIDVQGLVKDIKKLAEEANTTIIKGEGSILTASINNSVTNFIQLVSPQLVDRFSQTKLHCKAPNEDYSHMCRMHKSNNK